MTALDRFAVAEPPQLILNAEGAVPLIYWPVTPNFGDLLSPWLFGKLTGRPVAQLRAAVNTPDPSLLRRLRHAFKPKRRPQPHYIAIGSILSRVKDRSEVWGTGSFGTEQMGQINRMARYHAVRGPLTRALVKNVGVEVPRVYGDPALLVPLLRPAAEKTHEIGLVLRWSESEWLKSRVPDGVRLIDLGSEDVEATLDAITACKRIVTSSLHGLIIADTYGIPNAWLASDSPKGGEFKYFDYFLSVGKVRAARAFDFTKGELSEGGLLAAFDFDDRPITWDPLPLLRACPFLVERA